MQVQRWREWRRESVRGASESSGLVQLGRGLGRTRKSVHSVKFVCVSFRMAMGGTFKVNGKGRYMGVRVSFLVSPTAKET